VAKFTKEVKKLKKRLDKAEAQLKDISIEISTTTQTSMSYWNNLKKRAHKAYEEARAAFADWAKSDIPAAYKLSLQTQIRRIKKMKFTPPVRINYNTFVASDRSKRTVTILVSDAIDAYILRTTGGEKKFNDLMNLTQQLNITEDEVNKAIKKGFIEGAEGVFNRKKKVGAGSLYGAQRNLQKELLKDALDEKYIALVDKNGKLRNYNLKSYAELVARTKLTEAQASSTVNLSLAYGSGLVQVSSHNTETEYDAQFEGKVFDLTGENPRFPNATDLPPFHPNCLHTITVYFEDAHSKEEIDKMSDFSKGKTKEHPTRKGFIPINERELVA
jgi:hypothetical protein